VDETAVTVNPAPVPGLPLRSTDWRLTHYYDGMGALIAVLPGTEINALFGDNGSVTGTGGCNTYSADYQASETTLTIGALSVTNALCSSPDGIMTQESAYLNILRTAATYRIVGSTLEVKNGAGVVILQYQGQ
jgi:heat shock protein HslJ